MKKLISALVLLFLVSMASIESSHADQQQNELTTLTATSSSTVNHSS